MKSEDVQDVVLTPGAGQMILSLASKHGMSFTVALRELIDNALDAGARSVHFLYSRDDQTLVIRDDGRGTMNVQDIITPYKHRSHATTGSGRYGIGGTASQIYLTDGVGLSVVRSVTREAISFIEADYGKMIENDRFSASMRRHANADREATGTTITLHRCRELNKNHYGAANRELSFKYAPALRKGIRLGFDAGTGLKEWTAYTPPKMVGRPIHFEVTAYGFAVKGFCGLVKQGEPNLARGWSVAYGHRFIDTFKDPIGSRTVDASRIYAEVTLPREWKNINDHKDGFTEDPVELWDALAEACAPILDRAEQEGISYEIDTATRDAQDLLDRATGHAASGIREKRDSPSNPTGAVEPKGTDIERRNFTKIQPGKKGSKSPRRILLTWASNLDDPYEISAESRVVRVQLSLTHPGLELYRGSESGPYLFNFVMLAIASDSVLNDEHYESMFPSILGQSIPENFGKMLGQSRREPQTI